MVSSGQDYYITLAVKSVAIPQGGYDF